LLDRKPETRELARPACSSTWLDLDKFVTIQATIFAPFVNELARANWQVAREPKELESKGSNIGRRIIKAKQHQNFHGEYKDPPYNMKFNI
jgi:hypothetical protein